MRYIFFNNSVKHIFLISIFATSFSGQSDHFDKKYNQVERKAVKLEQRITRVEQRETITYEVVSGYETITVVPGQTIKKEKLTKVKDGYVATVPCDFIIK